MGHGRKQHGQRNLKYLVHGSPRRARFWLLPGIAYASRSDEEKGKDERFQHCVLLHYPRQDDKVTAFGPLPCKMCLPESDLFPDEIFALGRGRTVWNLAANFVGGKVFVWVLVSGIKLSRLKSGHNCPCKLLNNFTR